MATLNENVNRYTEFDDDLRALIVEKGGTIPENTTAENLLSIIEDLMGGGDASATLKAIIEGTSDYDLVIPEGITTIREQCFTDFQGLKTVTIPSSVNYTYNNSFENCNNLTKANVNATFVGNIMFSGCPNLTTINLANTQTIHDRLAGGCSGLTTVNFPNTLTRIYRPFYNCPNLEFITIESGFNCNGLDLSVSTNYSAATIVSWLNALADRTGQSTYTLRMGSTNLAKLSAAEIAIATNKNWNLA